MSDSYEINGSANPLSLVGAKLFGVDANGTVGWIPASLPVTALAASGGSDLVGFLQGGTGAVARTVQAKLRDVVSVKDFGAVGDGIADDTAAIQAALDYVLTFTKDRPKIYIPSGVYILTSTIDIQSDSIIIEGAGQSAPWNSKTVGTYIGGTVLKYTGTALSASTAGVIKLGSLVGAGTPARNIIIRDLSIECDDKAVAIWCARANSCTFERITTDKAIWGMTFYDSNNNSNIIESCEFYDPPSSGGGLDLRASCHSSRISNCRFNNKVTGTRNPTFAIRLNADVQGSQILIEGNNFDYYRVVTAHIHNVRAARGLTIAHNYIECRDDGVTAGCVILAEGSGVNIHGNRFTKPGSASLAIDYGINMYSAVVGASITNNYFAGWDIACVRIASGTTNVFLSGNETQTLPLVRDQSDGSTVTVVDQGSITSGNLYNSSYTPTLTPVSNIGTAAAFNTNYYRIGNIVTVFGRIDVAPSASSTVTELTISLPISSVLTAADVGGTGHQNAGNGARIYANTPTNTAAYSFISTGTSLVSHSFMFSYIIR